MIEVSIRSGEVLFFEDVRPLDFHAKIKWERRRLARNSIIAGICYTIPLALFIGLEPTGAFDAISVAIVSIIVIPVFFLATYGVIFDLCSRFYRAFTTDELKDYKTIVRLTDQRVVLVGRKQFNQELREIPTNIAVKERDTIVAQREGLAAVEIEARFYTFRINLCLKEFSPTQAPRRNLVSLEYEGEKLEESLAKVEKFARSVEPMIPVKHLDHPVYIAAFYALLVGLIFIIGTLIQQIW